MNMKKETQPNNCLHNFVYAHRDIKYLVVCTKCGEVKRNNMTKKRVIILPESVQQ